MTLRILTSLAVAVAVLAGPAAAGAQGPANAERHAATGQVRFLGSAPGRPIARPAGVPASAAPEAVARAFMRSRGRDFGVAEPDRDLAVTEVRKPLGAASSVRLQQRHRGVPVLGGELAVNLDKRGNVLSAGGELSPEPELTTTPAVSAAAARQVALAATADARDVPRGRLVAGLPVLNVYDHRLLEAPGRGQAQLVWRLEVTSPRSDDEVRELVLVDALTGKVALHFNQIAHARSRRVCDAEATPSDYPCTDPTRSEGQGPTGIADVDQAYDYSGDIHDFLFERFGRDSLDGKGMRMVSTVRWCRTPTNCPYRNAFWDGAQMTYGQGFTADDTVGHEFTHGFTEFTSGLLYYGQSGAINESLSDVFGEFVDLTNGAGNDTPEVRWLQGEDLPRGALRSMANPPAFGDPDRVRSSRYFDIPLDSGGVHTNSGVNNKAAFLITDGGTFNGRTVTGLGIDKAARIYYEAQTALLTSGTGHNELFDALQQACANLHGTAGITAADCVEVKDAVTATQMNLQPIYVPVHTAPTCTQTSQQPVHAFNDDLEKPAGQWIASAIVGEAPAWYYPQESHPFPNVDATWTTSGTHNIWGDAPGVVSDSAIAMAAGVTVPPSAFMTFRHALGLEAEWNSTTERFDANDAGVVEYSVAGGPWTDAGPLFTHSGYGSTVTPGGQNPLGGREAFTGVTYAYGKSRLDLATLAGQSVRFRFRLATDNGEMSAGWFIDDIRIFTCSADTTKPVAKAPTHSLVPNSSLGSASTTARAVPLRVAFGAAADDRALAGDLRYLLQRGFGSATPPYSDATGWTTLRPAEQLLIPGQTYRFRVLARDPAGNVSAPATGAALATELTQEDGAALAYTGAWLPRAADATASGGHVRATTTAGARAALSFTGARSLGVVMPKAAALGSAKVCLYAGASTTGSCQTTDLSPSWDKALGPRRLAFVRGSLNPATSYRVEVSAVSGRVELDGILLVR